SLSGSIQKKQTSSPLRLPSRTRDTPWFSEMGRVLQHVLVVDDEPKITEVVESYLRKAGFAPLTAAGGIEALQLFEKVRPALVILDLMLPDLSGEEVCRSLRARSRVPIIMLTAKVGDSDAV